jgi:photosystem II stability/assembly factor-like uncharacterized protein
MAPTLPRRPWRPLAIFALLVALAGALATALPAAGQAPGAVGPALFSPLTFREIGPATMSGRVVDLAVVEGSPRVFYVATATGGLWKTTDNGVTFAPVFSDEGVHAIGAVAVDQSNPDIVWVGSGEAANRQSVSWGDGVYKSTDAGRTWTNMGLRDSKHIARVAIHPTDSRVVFVATVGHLWGPNRERGLFKSIDGGGSWKNVLFVDEDTGVTDVAIDPSDPSIMYAATYQRRRTAFGFHGGGPGSALYASTDGGDTWRRLEAGLPEGDKGRIGISIYRKDPRIVYICVEQGLRYNASTAYLERRAGIYRSEDHGDTWRHMSDWNPRPMYASQIRVDPNDDQRIYMMNEYSFSDDGGRTFTSPDQSLHGDDRALWINPGNSNHVIKGDDGGLGISYDRGLKWLYVASLPVSQWYRISVDTRRPYYVYGGLQDNGSWMGPSATDSPEGILNHHWVRTGGGDGFFNLIAPDNRTLYTASQFLGLSRLDLGTFERKDIRPGNKRGFIQARRNWDTWGRPGATQELGNAMAPANWDAPILISPHDANTIYAGTDRLWKSMDRGDTWVDLGALTTGVDRSTLAIMGQKPGERTPSLDDGVPYYPTLTAIAESPRRAGLLYVGTDDGQLQASADGGRSWTEVSARLPGLPTSSWIAGIEASRFDERTVYVAVDNHRSDDYRNYLYRSTDAGASWTSIVGDLPADRVIRTVREDPRRRDLLYAGTELGLFVTMDGGRHWFELKNNLPRLPVYDLVVHPRDNDLVIATHGRGVWILDQVAALQETTEAVLGADAHLYSVRPADMIRRQRTGAHLGDMVFRGRNPPEGAIIDYHLGRNARDVRLSVHDEAGSLVTTMEAPDSPGLHRVVWNLRHPALASGSGPGQGQRRDELAGPFVVPGTYTVRLTAGDTRVEQPVVVGDDPRLTVTPVVRRQWTAQLLELGDLFRSASSLVDAVGPPPEEGSEPPERIDLRRQVRELRTRIRTLYGEIEDFVGPPTADQRDRQEFLASTLRVLEAKVKAR